MEKKTYVWLQAFWELQNRVERRFAEQRAQAKRGTNVTANQYGFQENAIEIVCGNFIVNTKGNAGRLDDNVEEIEPLKLIHRQKPKMEEHWLAILPEPTDAQESVKETSESWFQMLLKRISED
jgi:hypothetical protein